jgi:hypothetical protein
MQHLSKRVVVTESSRRMDMYTRHDTTEISEPRTEWGFDHEAPEPVEPWALDDFEDLLPEEVLQ